MIERQLIYRNVFIYVCREHLIYRLALRKTVAGRDRRLSGHLTRPCMHGLGGTLVLSSPFPVCVCLKIHIYSDELCGLTEPMFAGLCCAELGRLVMGHAPMQANTAK